MKKLFTVLVLMFSINIISLAQQAPLAKGEKQINFGLGFNTYGLPVYGSVDFAVHKDVTITPQINLIIDDVTRFGALVKGDYHWNYLLDIQSNWDFYTGARLGFLTGSDFKMVLGLQLGGRWYWNNDWGLNLEFGGGSGFGTTLGLSKKI